jgi:hypothetical protein
VLLLFCFFFEKLILIRLSLSPISLCDLSNWCVSCRESFFLLLSQPIENCIIIRIVTIEW